MQTMAAGLDEYSILRFEVSKGTITAAGRGSLPECGIGQLIPIADGNWDILVHCPFSNTTRRIAFDAVGHVSNYEDLPLPSRPFDPSSGQVERKALKTQSVVYKGTGDDLAILTGANELCRLNLQDRTGPCSSFPTRMQGRWIPSRPWPSSADGRILYFGSGPALNRSQGMASAIEVVDTQTMTLVSSINVSMPFRTLAVDSRGEKLYAANPDAHAILQIDSNSKKEIKKISLSGFRPAIVIPVP